MRAFDHTTVRTADEAVAALAAGGASNMLIAGGADLLSLMKSDLVAPTRLIDLKLARDLHGVTIQSDGSARIGALTTLADIERDDSLAERLPILRAAVRDAATPQLRNVATVGGNLMQRTRCWYFRGPYTCWQKGGDTCFARGGQNKYHAVFDQGPCVSAHPSDLAPAMLALDASVSIQASNGQRTIPLDELLRPPAGERRHESTLAPSEVIVAVTIPPQLDGARGVYLKMMDRHAWAYALVSAAAQLAIADGVVTYARIVLGGVANVPYRVETAEAHIIGQPLTAERASAAADLAIAGATPLAHNQYKVPLARELARRAILLAGGVDW
jgi:xanthine dehydrogenase YagS FAD-binding subunit